MLHALEDFCYSVTRLDYSVHGFNVLLYTLPPRSFVADSLSVDTSSSSVNQFMVLI